MSETEPRQAEGTPRIAAAAALVAFFALFFADQWLLYRIKDGPALAARAAVYVVMLGVAVVWSRSRPGPAAVVKVGAARAWIATALVSLAMAAVLLAGAGALVLLERDFGLHVLGPTNPLKVLNVKIALAAVQQVALQLFIFPACRALTGSAAAAVVSAAGLFAVMHVPNVALVALCFGAGLMWFVLYQRTGRLAPLVVSHMLLALLVRLALPQHVHYNLEIGGQMPALKADYDRIRDAGQWERFESISSAEYYAAQGGTDADYVRALYRDLLGRLPAQGELDEWRSEMRHRSRADFARWFFNSDEFLARPRP